MRHLAALLSLLVGSSYTLSQNKSIPEYRDPDAAAIYSAVLGKKLSKTQIPIISRQTDAGIDDKRAAKCLRGSKQIDRALVEKFLWENRSPLLLPRELALSFPHKLVPQSDIDVLFKKDLIEGWQKFREAYSHSYGVFHFSAIAYDKAGTTALVYVANNCGALCGEGRYVIVKKTGSVWKESKVDLGFSCGWVS